MCFSPKMKMPKVQPQAIVPPPAPLLDAPTAVKFGGSSDDAEREGGDDRGRIDLDDTDSNKKTKPPTTTTKKAPSTLATNRRARSISRAIKGGF